MPSAPVAGPMPAHGDQRMSDGPGARNPFDLPVLRRRLRRHRRIRGRADHRRARRPGPSGQLRPPVHQGLDAAPDRRRTGDPPDPAAATDAAPRARRAADDRDLGTPWPRRSACSARSPQVRPQDPVHRQDQPQRVADLPEQVRPDHVRAPSSRRATWARSRVGATDLLRLRRVRAARSRRSPQAFQHAHELGMAPSCGATCATPRSRRRTRTTTCRPTSPARPTTSASPSRPTSSSRSCPRTTAATTRSKASARPTSGSTTS